MIDRLLIILSGAVALMALAGVMLVQWQASENYARLATEMAGLRQQIGSGPEAAAVAAATVDPEALAAIEQRLAAIEAQPVAGFVPFSPEAEMPMMAAQGFGATTPEPLQPSALASGPAPINPDLPTEDCIPADIRFMALPGEAVPICQTEAVVSVSAITAMDVTVDGVGPIAVGGFTRIPATPCTIMVFSADPAGFSEMRVTCQQ